MSSKSNRRKITVEKSGQRPSVFERLGTKAEQRDQSASNSGYCRHWKNTGNCPFGSSCKNAMHHTLISPSKQRAASKDKEHSNLRPINKSQSTSSSHSRLHSTVLSVKESGTPSRTAPTHSGGPGTAGSHWEEDWNERSLEHADEKELERRRQQLQRELELQMKKEMRKRKISTSGGSSTTVTATTTKKAHRSSSSSSSTSSGSSSSSTGSTSEASSSSRGRRASSKSHPNKQGRMSKRDSSKATSKSVDPKKSRDVSKESTKKRLTPASSRMRSNSRSRQRSQANVAPVKRRRDSTSADSSGSDKRKQGRSNTSQHQPSSSRMRGRSPSPERKLPPERKRPALTHDKSSKRRDASPPPRKSSLPPSRGGTTTRKRSATPPPRPPRRRSPSPQAPRGRSGKRHGSTSRNASPVPVRRRSPSVERKDSRRGHTPPSPPADRSYAQRGGGRTSRRNSPETTHRNQPSRDGRQRALPSRDSRQSPDRRPLPPRAASREPLDNKRADWGRGRDYGASSPPPRAHHRSSPESSNGSTTRAGVNRDLRADKLRPKEHDRERERRRDALLPVDKGREKVRSRAEEGELPSLLSLMTQHPGHFTPQPQSSRPRALPRDEPQMDHRSSARDRNRFERYEGDRGGDTYAEHASDDHHRVGSGGNTKRGPPPRRELSPLPRQPRPAQKSREWGEFADNRGRDWERRSSTKGSGGNSSSMPLRQWGPVPGSEDQPRQNRMLPPLSVRNAMQAARRAGANSPNGAASQPSATPGSPQSATPDSASKGSSETAQKEKSSDDETNSQKDVEQEVECSKEVSIKRPREVTPEKDESEPARKRQCMEELRATSPITAPQAAVTATSGLDLMESDLSDISDDADDILNAEGVEEPGEIESEEKYELQGTAACEEEEEEEPVEDLLDTMDFEEISDGELEAEEARGGVDALTVDWAALMSQTRSRDGDETKEARTHRWQGSQLLQRLGVSMKLCGPELASKLGIVLADDSATEQKDGEEEHVVKLLDPVAGVHVALRARRQQRESLFQLRDRRGLSAADDLAFRRQLNGLPAKKPGHQFNQSADPSLFHQAMQMLLAK